MAKINVPGGTVRRSKDGSGGGAITTGSGKGTSDSPHIHQTTVVDKDGNITKSHTTVGVDGLTRDMDKKS